MFERAQPRQQSRASRPLATGIRLAMLLIAGLGVTCARHADTTSAITTLYEQRPASWFEDLTYHARVSPDGRWALYGAAPRLRLVDLTSGNEDAARLVGPFETIDNAVFGPGGRLVRLVAVEGTRRWLEEGAPLPLDVPADALPVWSANGRHTAFFRSTAPTEGVTLDNRVLPVPGHLLRIAWTPDSATLVTVTRAADYTVGLGALSVATGAFRVVADGLDADVFPAQIAVSPDSREVFVALASEGSPDRRARHDPMADRDLDLWAVDLTTGAKRPVVVQPGDDFAPEVVEGRLIWTHADVRPSVVVLPVTGGPMRTIVDRGELPEWSHDGRHLAFMVGGWRLRDVALPLDAHVVDIDDEARLRSSSRPLIVGFHEDFTPAWSPDGRWLAFHSHRSSTPVPSYSSQGSTDDLWLALAADPAGTERRLTDFGHEAGGAVWSPDGSRLAFVSHDHDQESTPRTWIVTIDPETGARRDATALALPPEITRPGSVAWSPDGSMLAVASSIGPGRQSLWLVSLGGGAAKHLIDYSSRTFGGVAWTPDGRTLIYSALAGAQLQLFAIEATGGAARQLTNDDSTVVRPKVSPDGRWIAATSMHHTRRVLRRALAALTTR